MTGDANLGRPNNRAYGLKGQRSEVAAHLIRLNAHSLAPCNQGMTRLKYRTSAKPGIVRMVQRTALIKWIGRIMLLLLSAAGSLVSTEVSGAEVPFLEDFELLPEGSVHGHEGWSVSKGEVSVVAGPAPSGLKSLRSAENSEVALSVEGDGSVFWVNLWVMTQGSPFVPAIPRLPKKSAVLVFDSMDGIQALDGDGAGGGMIVSSGIALDGSRWYRITLKLDFDVKKWDLYVDGARRLTNLGFHSNDAPPLSGFMRTNYTQSHLDALSIADVGLTDDTDQDRLTDLDEMRVYGTDPLSADTDGDGMRDGDEIAAGTQPTDDTSFLYLRISAQGVGSALQLSAPTVEGKTYELQEAEDIGTPDSWHSMAQFIGDGFSWVWVVTDDRPAIKRFYRLVVLPQ